MTISMRIEKIRVTALCLLLVGLLGAHTALATTATPSAPSSAEPVDLVVVIKSERVLYLYSAGLVVQQFPISLGGHPLGDKRKRGDQRTPEGFYTLDWRNPHSEFYRSLHISYPNARDRARARARGVDPGDNIMIHGQPVYAFHKRTGDWTYGCIAVSDHAMDVLWQRVPVGTPIEIYP